jgi:hypothetical protein
MCDFSEDEYGKDDDCRLYCEGCGGRLCERTSATGLCCTQEPAVMIDGLPYCGKCADESAVPVAVDEPETTPIRHEPMSKLVFGGAS